jgi:hypothetical protein
VIGFIIPGPPIYFNAINIDSPDSFSKHSRAMNLGSADV